MELPLLPTLYWHNAQNKNVPTVSNYSIRGCHFMKWHNGCFTHVSTNICKTGFKDKILKNEGLSLNINCVQYKSQAAVHVTSDSHVSTMTPYFQVGSITFKIHFVLCKLFVNSKLTHLRSLFDIKGCSHHGR